MTDRTPVSGLRNRIPEILDQLEQPGRWMVITRHGRDAAALVSMDLLDNLLTGLARLSAAAAGPPDRSPWGLEIAAAAIPETKSTVAGDAATDPDALMREIEATRAAAGLDPLDPEI